ncbi:MAG: hypothetical protein ABSC23_06885 [Bryobacteraceae bacterium]|jgi:hypothetical protein
MIIRIRFGRASQGGGQRRGARRAALVAAALLTPAAAAALALGCWRIAADLNWTGSFAISSGFFSHWQVWLGAAVLLQACSRFLVRCAKRGNTAAS